MNEFFWLHNLLIMGLLRKEVCMMVHIIPRIIKGGHGFPDVFIIMEYGGREKYIPHGEEDIIDASSWDTRFAYTSSRLGDIWLVDGTSTDVDAKVFIKKRSIESQ